MNKTAVSGNYERGEFLISSTLSFFYQKALDFLDRII